MSILKPVGVFWDIENCHVPKGKSALKIIERIRKQFFQDFREAEFICVCDINKEAESTIKDLNDGQINVVHINATAKNAADDKIRQSLRRFSDSHPPGTKVILISSDVNFASDLSDLRHRKKFEVVLIHKAQVSEALLTCATEHYLYEDIIKDLPDRPGYKEVSDNVLVAYGYSKDCPDIKVKQVLKMLSNNCGGRVISIGPLFAILKFETPEFAERAKKRMNGEEVFGRKITVCLPEETPFFNTVKKLLSSHTSKRQESPSPQRRPGRERNNSRSYTPNNYDSGFGYQNGSNYLLGDNYSDENDVSQLSEYQFTPKIYDLKSYKTPGGPVVSSCHVPTASANSSSSSPNHTHTLPNSNSEKYYHIKSKPSSLDGSPFNNGSACDIQQSSSVMSGPSFPLGDLNKVTSGCDSTAVFKRKLSDIPIPSFGFRDIPPPPIKYSAETKSLSCDPIQLVENASKDSTTYIMSSSSGLDLTPHPDLQTPPSQPAVSLFGGHQNTHFNSSQGSAFTKLQPVSLYQNHIKQPYSQHHQPRSMSVPVHNNTAVPKDKLASENELSALQGYPPANTFRSQSQNAGVFKKPISPQKTFNRNHLNSGSYSTSNCQSSPRVQNSSQSNGKDHLRHSFSSDGEDRPYSPSGNSSSNIKAGFRPRLPSAPLVSLPNSRTPSPFSCPSSSRPRSKQHGSNLYRVPTPDEIGEPSTDYINPEFNPDRDSYVELIVSNLDYNIQPREWRKIIYATFFPHVKIGVKMIQFQENREQFYDMMKSSSWQELGKISREVMELLRQQSNCIMPVSRFIPAYHHYFGRQCRVADYGYTKLQELFEAIPHAIQILGTGDRKAITLSPRAQLKRFTTDILKVVKAQPAKQVMLDHFPPAYERVLNKPLYLPHYGVCFMEDVLMDIPTTTLIVIEEGNQTLLALPRRDQTPEEVERTKQFALEVVDLLKQNPQCKMPFNKFIPAYHHHFGRQCRVADYGFSKLGDLFEAVCHIVEIEEDGEEKFIHLCLSELRKVLCDQLTTLITPHGFIPLHKLLSEYGNQFGFNLKLEDFKVNSLKALLQKLKSHIKIEVRNGQEVATLVKESQIPKLGLQVMQLLMDESGGSLPLMELTLRYESLFGVSCDVDQIREELSDYIQIDEEEGDSGGVIRLTTQQMLGRNLRLLLLHKQRISMSDLPSMYKGQYGVELTPALYGFSSLYQLLLSFSHILDVKGKPTQKYIVLSSVLSVPGTLPPARVDLKSPTQTNSYQDQNGSPTQGLELLRHASNLWDPRIASQGGVSLSSNFLSNTSPPVIATKIMEILNSAKASASVSNNEKVSSCLISPDDIPETWQMKAGADADKMCRGTIGLSVDSETNQNLSPQHSCETVSQTELDSRTSPHGSLPCDVAAGEEYFCDDLKEEDLFSPNNLPLETSSTTSSQHNSSHSSTNSPIKRRPRIAANFNMAS
uniref:HTH OST-type domain-containing protein n=1 Tax=Biomphalaria glabrata TaxID=6526 RepID=A0A2C9KRA0_BIOGL